MEKSLKGKPIILASASPRRRTLLERAQIAFETSVSDAEEISGSGLPPERLVQANALLKAENVAQKFCGRIVLGADTVVELDGEVFGKPRDLEQAFGMLSALSGRTHRVLTAVALVERFGGYACGERIRRDVRFDSSSVTFKKFGIETVRDYVSKVEVLDKAGAYAAQECSELIIERIDGEFDTVMGLPCALVRSMLADFLAARDSGSVE
ncbi:MAG: septum formation protein Maf [Verrucomicrobia bacterium]|nr:MAG: septum formation protein Maf [Verrucomicrobiota bacterium]